MIFKKKNRLNWSFQKRERLPFISGLAALAVVMWLMVLPSSSSAAAAAVSTVSPDGNETVLLLNSYHKGFFWTDEITRGVERASWFFAVSTAFCRNI
ncbi:MAG: hypothetical protein R6V54_10680 [Desulfobacteraceae bacterium]